MRAFRAPASVTSAIAMIARHSRISWSGRTAFSIRKEHRLFRSGNCRQVAAPPAWDGSLRTGHRASAAEMVLRRLPHADREHLSHRETLFRFDALLCALPPVLRDQALGPPSGHAWTKFGHGDLWHVEQINIPAMIWRMASRIVYARLTGFAATPSSITIPASPYSSPRRITSAERSELDRKVRDQ